jgi:hypothetical protein
MFLYLAKDIPGQGGELTCPHCRLSFRGGGTAPDEGSPVSACWVCGNGEFYVQKDFNRELGLCIVLACGMIVFLIMLLIGHLEGIICLAAIALVDWVIYRWLSLCTVCYLCQSIYRGFPASSEHHGFYLGNEEKYKKRRQKWLEQLLEKDPPG